MKLAITTPVWISCPGSVTRKMILDATEAYSQLSPLSFVPMDMSDYGWVRFGEATIVIEVANDIDEQQIAILEKAKEEAQKVFDHKMEQIDSMINNLRALPNLMPGDPYDIEPDDPYDIEPAGKFYRLMCLQETGEEQLIASSVEESEVDGVLDRWASEHPEHNSYFTEELI